MHRIINTLVVAALLFVAPGLVSAQTKVTLPESILAKIRSLTDATGTCHDKTLLPIGSERFADLGAGRLLILLEIADYMCTVSNTVAPLVVDSETNTVKLGEEMEGAVSYTARGPGGAYWLVTQTQIEASTPNIYRSKDGLMWNSVALPGKPEGDWSPFLFLTGFCFENGEIRILLNDQAADPEPEYYTYSMPFDRWAEGEWRLVAAHGSKEPAEVKCSPTNFSTGAWERSNYSMTDKIQFKNGEFHLIIPGNIEKNE